MELSLEIKVYAYAYAHTLHVPTFTSTHATRYMYTQDDEHAVPQVARLHADSQNKAIPDDKYPVMANTRSRGRASSYDRRVTRTVDEAHARSSRRGSSQQSSER